jgi:hypothetical protein
MTKAMRQAIDTINEICEVEMTATERAIQDVLDILAEG